MAGRIVIVISKFLQRPQNRSRGTGLSQALNQIIQMGQSGRLTLTLAEEIQVLKRLETRFTLTEWLFSITKMKILLTL